MMIAHMIVVLCCLLTSSFVSSRKCDQSIDYSDYSVLWPDKQTKVNVYSDYQYKFKL